MPGQIVPGPHLRRANSAESSDLLAAAVAQLPPLCLVDRSGALLQSNAAFEALAEKLRAVRLEPAALLPGSDLLVEFTARREPIVRPLEVGDPSVLRLRARYSGIWDDSETLTAVAVLFEDVREHHALRHKLSLVEERLDDITRLASDWIWETDTRLAITFVSSRVAEVLGLQPIELLGKSFLDLGRFTNKRGGSPPLDPQRRIPFRDLPFTMAHRDGTMRLFHISSLPVFCPQSGEFLGFRGTARDVTEQAAASARVAQSQNQLTQAIESISEGFSLFDADDRLVLFNGKYLSYFPASASAIVAGASFRDIMRAALAAGDIAVPLPEHERWLADRLKLRREPLVSFELAIANGRWIRISDHKTADGSIVGIRTDITDAKHREEALYAAKETAEIASRSKSEFLANISHELRTPLNAIIGFSEIMREQIFGPLGSPQYLEYAGDVLDSAHHLLDVINDILDIAKAEAGKLELIEDDVDVANVAAAAIRLVQERAQRNHVTLRSHIDHGLPLLHADERKLKQILLNLLTNAVKFTPTYGSIEVAAQVAPSGDLVLSVSDTGIGIAEQDIATALAPFGQVDSKLNRRYEGTGLGLPLCNAMTKLHGGQLTIDSVVGKGTTVTIQLPAARVRSR